MILLIAARRQRVISGIQPTGNLHLGNYLGAIKNWIQLQILYGPLCAWPACIPAPEALILDTFFCVVDMHAITVPQNPTELRKASLNTAAVYIASGIDPTKVTPRRNRRSSLDDTPLLLRRVSFSRVTSRHMLSSSGCSTVRRLLRGSSE